MLVAYVAGPYRAKTSWEVDKNVQRARAAARHLWAVGYAVICPHINGDRFDGAGVSHEEILKGCLEITRRCDIVFVLPGWQASGGTLAEIQTAKEAGIPVIYIREEQAATWEGWASRETDHLSIH